MTKHKSDTIQLLGINSLKAYRESLFIARPMKVDSSVMLIISSTALKVLSNALSVYPNTFFVFFVSTRKNSCHYGRHVNLGYLSSF